LALRVAVIREKMLLSHAPMMTSTWLSAALGILRVSCPLLFLFASQTTAIWPFPPKRFKSNALIGAGSLGLDKLQGRIIAFGDFDGDQLYVAARLIRFLNMVSLQD
jgi:hypothetical protein